VAFGTYRAWIYEADGAAAGRPDPTVRVATADDLARLEALLAAGVDHSARLAAGDLCIYVQTGAGLPVGLQWINLHLHQDRFFGAVSRPAPGLAYQNQMFVLPDYRSRGYGPRLMLGSLYLAAERGAERARGAVLSDNRTMIRLLEGVGFLRVGWQIGARFGSRLTLRLTRRYPHSPG
jgi:GNAT superfamily N-acetyltransferase